MARNETESRRNVGGNGTGIAMPFLNDMPETVRTVFGTSAELQSDFLTLWSHRAQAWLNWPKEVLACRDMGDLMEAQGRFLSTMQQHYKEYCDCVMKDALVAPEQLSGPGDRTPPEPQSRRERDSQEHRKAA